jgi:hypothetical protein
LAASSNACSVGGTHDAEQHGWMWIAAWAVAAFILIVT